MVVIGDHRGFFQLEGEEDHYRGHLGLETQLTLKLVSGVSVIR